MVKLWLQLTNRLSGLDLSLFAYVAVEQEFSHVAVVSVGEREPCKHQEDIDLLRENIRWAAASECAHQ